MSACKSDPKEKKEEETSAEAETPKVVQVVTKSMEFSAPDTIPSGWNTFVYKNMSTEPHFILLDKYPEGVNIENTKTEVVPAFDKGMQLIMKGKNDEAMEAFGTLPAWFSEIVFSGGTGLISPRQTAVSMVKLDPGYYVMECYVRMPDGSFHSSMGMVKELIVIPEDSGMTPPEADFEIDLGSENGIRWNGNPKAGKNIIRVNYKDQIVHENFVGHDLNLVAMTPNADLQTLEAWINWATPKGLMSSTLPEGFTFLGGTNDSPAGSSQYFEVELEPGQYVLISEVPDAASKGLLKTLEVRAEQ
ncbi:hypothetical protein [Robiginitalea sp. IMCC43444]|uniref:hypothetical protein n=1 Tax=Robiginitalea sp. IMCC43444 TaxID=3459121 RepID=UPI00404324BD